MSVSARRYVTQAKADEMRELAAFEWAGPIAKTFNTVTLEMTEWYIVPDDDPRLQTVDLVGRTEAQK